MNVRLGEDLGERLGGRLGQRLAKKEMGSMVNKWKVRVSHRNFDK